MSQYPPDLWTWQKCGESIRSLAGRSGFSDGDCLNVLGYELDLSNGVIRDTASGDVLDDSVRDGRQVLNTLFYVLSAYAAKPETQPTGKLISSKQFRGARFTECVMTRERYRVAKEFKDAIILSNAASALGGSRVEFQYGDIAIELKALPLVPITIVLTLDDGEFPADARLFYDETVEYYFDSEQTYFLTSLTISRLIQLSGLLNP